MHRKNTSIVGGEITFTAASKILDQIAGDLALNRFKGVASEQVRPLADLERRRYLQRLFGVAGQGSYGLAAAPRVAPQRVVHVDIAAGGVDPEPFVRGSEDP